MSASAKLSDTLTLACDSVLSQAMIDCLKEAEESFIEHKWKSAGIAVGHFVEAVVRFLEFKRDAKYTPISKPAPKMNPAWLSKCESSTVLHDSYRFHIPRLCLSIYGMRNKKGYGHLSVELCKRVDVTAMMDACRWILAEIVQIESNLSEVETSELVEQIVEKPVHWIWKANGVFRLTKSAGSVENDILVLLYYLGKSNEREVLASIETSPAYLRKCLKKLHKNRLIEYSSADRSCEISPIGITKAEQLVVR